MNLEGPLPIVDAGNVLQRQSIRALQDALPLEDYVFRDERSDDYGVDGSLELLSHGRATNIRAQIQLKGRSGTELNATGGIPVRVATSNLNYLLNGLCPLYVLFRSETRELWFANAREEWQRLEQENSDWRTQETVTIYFKQRLDAGALAQLRLRIIDDAKVQRSVSERVHRLKSTPGQIVVDAQSLAIADSHQVVEVLGQLGQTMTSSGLAAAVIERGRTVPTKQLLDSPRAALAVAHAQFSLARYYDAAASLRQLLLSKPTLAAADRSLLDILLISTRRMLEELDEAAYERAMLEWSKDAPDGLAAQYEISRAWSRYGQAVIDHLDPDALKQAHADLRIAFQRGRVLGNDLALYIDLLELTLQQHEMEEALLQAVALQDLAERGSGDAHRARVVERAAQKYALEWFARLTELETRTRTSSPRLHCEVWLLHAHATLSRACQTQLMALTGHGSRVEPKAIANLLQGTQRTLALARSLENRELELSAIQNLARALDLSGRQEEATVLAREALEMAELSGCTIHARQLAAFVQGDDRFSARLQQLVAASSASEEDLLADAGDDQLVYMATTMAAANQLPDRRIPNIVRSLRGRKHIELERRNWCRHVTLAEHNAHMDSELTMYAHPTPLRLICSRLGYEMDVPSEGVQYPPLDFRDRFCRGCMYRQPHSRATRTPQAARNRAKAERRKRRSG